MLLLAQHFVTHFAASSEKKVTGILPAAAKKLAEYPWPGNVRELQNCMERAVTLCRHSELAVEDLPKKVRDAEPSRPILADEDPRELVPMEEIERRYILRVFETTDQNKSLAAKVLGFDRKTLYRKLRRYGVIAPSESDD